MEERCEICGNIITSIESIRNGMGAECAHALNKARFNKMLADEQLRKEYYSIEAKVIIQAISNKRFRSAFRKSFKETLIKQANWLSRKQKDIATELLVGGAYEDMLDTVSNLEHEFLESLPVSREEIEIARQQIRGKKEKKKAEKKKWCIWCNHEVDYNFVNHKDVCPYCGMYVFQTRKPKFPPNDNVMKIKFAN